MTGFSGADYTVSSIGGETRTEFVKSRVDLRNVLVGFGMPVNLIEDTMGRLHHERLVEVSFEK